MKNRVTSESWSKWLFKNSVNQPRCHMTHKSHTTSVFIHMSLIVFRSVKYLINYGIVRCFSILISIVVSIFVMFSINTKVCTSVQQNLCSFKTLVYCRHRKEGNKTLVKISHVFKAKLSTFKRTKSTLSKHIKKIRCQNSPNHR